MQHVQGLLPSALLWLLTGKWACRPACRRHRDIDRKDILLIEHLIRKGRRQLELLSSASVTGVMHLQPQASGSGNGSNSGSNSSSGGSGGPTPQS